MNTFRKWDLEKFIRLSFRGTLTWSWVCLSSIYTHRMADVYTTWMGCETEEAVRVLQTLTVASGTWKAKLFALLTVILVLFPLITCFAWDEAT